MTAPSEETIAFLKSSALFTYVSEDQIAHILSQGVTREFREGERLIHQDSLTESVFLLLDGYVKVEIDDIRQIATRDAGDIVGEMAMISQAPRSANCTAGTAVTAVEFSHDIFLTFLATVPGLALGLLQEVVRSIEDNLDLIYQLSRELQTAKAQLAAR